MVRKSKEKEILQTENYFIEILEWELSYSLSIGKGMKNSEKPYWEYASIEIHGEFVHPKKLLGTKVNATLLGKRDLDEILSGNSPNPWQPRCVGSLTVRGVRREYLGSIPQSCLWGVLPVLQNNGFRFINLHGEKLKYGSAFIWYISFDQSFDPEDY